MNRPDPWQMPAQPALWYQPGGLAAPEELAKLFTKKLAPNNPRASNEVSLAYILEKESLPATGSSQVIHVLLEAKPAAFLAGIRAPLNIAVVIDRSGTMRGAKIRNIREAAKKIVDYLEPSDYISVVNFDDTAQVIIPSMPCNDKPGMKAAIDPIRDGVAQACRRV
ncbi:VWA domain-containing protein [Dictyobacter kobayashii]|uniref:VWA domain-containing protein n=1 Tax=Dictyobacter kobayashii TaxID=2014872 RepID=UPI0010A963C0|nr:VWA domain-containing protein [Dictyobacter kobayashii]